MASSLFHANQMAAATEIVHALSTGSYAVLWALCQSGKTGTFNCVAQQMLADRRVKRVYLLCGSASVALKQQAHADALYYNEGSYKSGKFQVVFRTAFEKTHLIVEDSLIIIDESHLDASKGQQLDQFLIRHELSLTGAPLPRTKILSVSATPYAELAAATASTKTVVQLTPGPNYFGIKDYLAIGHLQETFDIKEQSKRFAAMLKHANFAGKWNIVRVKDLDTETLIRKACAAAMVDVKEYTQKTTNLAITREEQEAAIAEKMARYKKGLPAFMKDDEERLAGMETDLLSHHVCLEDAPSRTTVVFLKDRLRVGKVVPKQHVGFVWEDAESSKTDTVVQGLLGRMCGYIRSQRYKPYVFLPKATLARHPDCVIVESELERAIAGPSLLPHNFAHSASGRLAAAPDHEHVQCVPIKLCRTAVPEAEQWKLRHGDDTPARTKTLCLQALRAWCAAHPATFASFLTPEQLVEINGFLADPESVSYIRHLKGDSQLSWHRLLVTSAAAGTSLHGIHDIPLKEKEGITTLHFAVVYENYVGGGAGDVYAIFNTVAAGKADVLDKKHTLGKTDGLEIFSPGATPVAAVGGAGSAPAAVLRFSETAFSNPAIFRQQLKEILMIPSSTSLALGHVLADRVKGYYTFTRSAFPYASTADNELRSICSSVGEELGLTITPKYKLTDRKDVFHVTSIRWSTAATVPTEDPM